MKDEGRFAVPRASASASGEGEGAPQRRSVGEGNDHDASSPGPVPRVHVSPPCSGTSNPPFAACGAASAPSFSRPGLDQDEGDGAGQGDIRCFAPSSSHSVPGGSHPVLSSDPAPRPAAATAVAGDGEALASPSPASVSPSEPCSSSCSAPACAAAGSLPSLSSPSARQPQGAAPLRGGLPRTSSSAAFPAAPPPPPSSSSANSDRTGGATLCGGPRLSSSGAAPAAGASPATHSPGRSAEAARPRGRGDSAHAAGTFFEKGSECALLGAAPGGRGASPALVDGGGGYARESPATASPASLLSHSPFFASPLQGAGATGATAGSNRPQHPLVHASTPCWVKYGEEHYPEEAVPIEYQWVEDDGTCCCYVTDFLLYNKKGERLLQVETLDQDELADVALYGKLVHVALVHPPEALEARKHPTACQVYPHLLQQRRRQQNPRSRRNLQATPEDDGAAQASPRSPLAAGPRDGGDKSAGAERESAGRGGAEGDQTPIQGGREEGERKEDGKSAGDEGAGTSSLGGKKVFRKRGGMLHHPFITPKIPRAFRTFPVRVDLTEWTIDYGKSSSQTPYVWLISSLNRYYRLEKPAGRYAPVLQSLKYKFEVASRVIKQLSVDRLYPYQELVRHLTADSRLKKALAEKAPAEGPDKEKESRSGGRCSSSGDGGAKDGELEQPSQAACATGEDGEEAGGGGGDGAPSRKKARRQEAKENEKLSADEEEEDEEKEDGELASGKASSQQVSPRNGGLGSPENEEGSNADRLKEAFLSHPSSVAGDDFDDPAGADPSSSVLSPSSRLTPNSAHPSSASNLIGGDFGNLVLPPGLGSSSSLPLDPSSLFTSSKFISALAIKKNKNCHLLSLSDPDGTGVRTLPDGSRSPESPWGAPLAVEGCTEESLIEVFPFLESQVAAFEASTGVSGLLASPFMNALRARVFRWVGKMEGDSAVDEVPPLQQTTTPEIVGGRTSEGGLLSHQPDDVLLSLNEFGASCAAEGRHPSLSGSSIPFSGAAAGGLRGAGQGFLDSPPFGGDASAQGFFTGTRGGRRRGARGGRGRGAGGEGGGRGRGGRRFPRDSDASAFARLGGDYSRDIEGLGGLTDEDARGLRDGLDGRSRMEKGERLVKREGGDGREGDEDGATREGGGGGGDLSDEEESRKRVKREEDGRSGDREPWATKDETDPQRSMDTDEEEDKDEISTVPEWGIEGDPVDVKDELDLEAEDPAYARVPLPGSSFAPYEFPELLELQDFSRVFVEMLQLPNYPVDTLEAALLLSLSSSVAEEFSARAGWPPQTKGGSKKNARKQSAKIPQNTLPFIAASTSLAPAPEPFHFFSPSARVRREEVAAAAASGEGKGAAIKTGAALRDAAAMALAEAAKEEARESGSQGALQAAEEGEGDKADDANSGFEGEAKALDAKYTAATGRAGGEASREGGRTGDPEEERTDTDPQGGESDKAVGGPSQGEAGEVEATPSPPPAKQGNDDSPLPASISDSSSPAAPQEGASAAPERSSAGAAPPSSASQTPPSVGAACCSGPLAPFSSASLLRPSSFPVFLGDALFLRLVQLAFLHISDALSRHNKTGSSATGDPANPSADARAPLVSLLTAAAGAGTGGLVGCGSVAAAASGAAGGMDTPAAATWLGAGSPNGLCGSCSSGSAPERDSKVKGEEWSGDFGRWTALKKAGTERELEGAGSRLEGGKGGPAAASTKAVVGVAMKHFWRHAALGPKLRRLVPRHADEEEEEDGEKKTTARGDQEEAATRPRKSKAGERSREEDEAAEAEAPEDEAGEADGDVAVEEGETGKEARKERKEAKREASSFCESQGDAQLEDQEPEVLQMLNNAPRDLRLIDFLTWPLVLQRMLFDSLYTPRRVDVKKPRRRRAKNEEAPQNLEAESAENKAAKVEDDGEQAQDAANEDAEGESDAQALSSGHEEGEGGESAAQAEADMESKECSDNAASCPAAVKRRSSLSSAEDAGGAEEGPPSCTPPSPYAAEVSGSAAGEASMEEQGDSADKADTKAPPAEEVDGGAEVAEVQEGDAAADCGDPEEDKRVEEKRPATPKDERDGEDAEGEEGEENEQESEAGAKQEEGGAADGEETGHPETDPDAEEDREDEKEEPQEQDAGSAFGGARGRDKKRRRDGQEDGEEELDEQGRCRKTEKDVAQKADDEEAATPAEFKPQNARKKTRRTSSDVMGDEEGESGCKGRAGGEDEDEEDEEAEEEEFERLEWHLDDQKAAQCGILPSRAEAMAIALHDLRTHSDAAVPRRLQLLQWLIACIANGWMGKFFLDAKVEALFRARANTLRLRMASVAAGPPKPLGGPTGAAAGVKGEGGETEGAAASASPEAPVPPLSTATDDTAPVDAGERAEEPSAAAASSAKAEAPPAPSSSSSSPLPNDAGDGSVSSQSMPPGEPGGGSGAAPSGRESSSPSEPSASSLAAAAAPGAPRGRRGGEGDKKAGKGSFAESEAASNAPGGGRRRRGGGPGPAGAGGAKGGEDEEGGSVSEAAAGKSSSGGAAEGFEAEEETGRPAPDAGAAGSPPHGGEHAMHPSARGGVGRGGKKPMGRVSNWEMELLAQKFPIRGEILGEDRYLNRYFLVPTARGVPRIFVEAFAHTQIDPVEAIDGFVDHVAAAAMEQEERKKEKEEDDGAASTLAESAPAGGIPTSNASCPPPSSLSALSSSSQVPNGLDAGAGMPGGGAGAPVPVGLLPGDRVGERRSSRRIAQRHQLELLHEASSSGTPLAGSVLNGLGAGFARAEERKRKRGSLTGEGKKFGLVAPTAAMKSSVLSALLGSAFVEGASGVKKLQAQEGEKAKHVNDFVRRAVDFSSISTYLQYLEETLKACGLFVVPPGRPLQQLQQALSPYLTRERALKEKLRRVDQQFQQLAASCPLPTPPRVFIPPSLFAACIWHGCRLLLQLEEALLLPLFASSWGFASVFQKQQHVLRLFHESQDRVASKRSSPSASLSQSRGERSDGRRAVLLSEDEGSGASSCGRSREKEREEGKRTEDEKESGEESGWRRRASDAKRRGGKDEEDDTCDALKEQDELAQKLQTRVWPQDVLHKCLSALAAHANVMGGEKKKKPEEPKASMKREEEEKEVKLKVEDTLAAGGLASREENAKTEKADHEETVREEQREAEEQEAQWMERRICLVVFAQLLLYIEKRLHTLSNVHTATWHIQQHHQWRREVTALGGAAALAQLALPLPSFEFSASPPAGAKSEGEEKVQCRGAEKGARGGSARKAATSEESRRERGGTRKGREEDADEQEKADEGGESDDEEGEETQDEGEEDGEKPSLDWQSRDGEDDPEKAHDDKDADDETRAEGGGLPPSPSLSPPAKADEFMPAATPESSAPEAEPASSAAAAVSLAASSSESCALPPDSPLQRILALIDAIGWDRDPTFSYLRTLRQSELEEMRRTREEEEKPRWAALLERGEMDGAQGGASASSSFVPEGEEDPLLSWTRVRNRHDVLAVWGFYLNIWKAFGLERQKVIDARTTVDRNTFLSLLAHDEQRAHLPDVGTRLFYFRRGHEQMMTAIQQEYGDTVEGRRWVDSTSMPLSIPYELGRVEELIVDSISYHPGIISPLPPRAAPALSASCLSSSLLSGLGGSEAETGSSLPEKLYSFSIVDDPYALGLLVGDASRTKARSVPSQGGRRDASGPASLGSTPAASAAPTAGSPPASLCTSSAPTTADLLLSSRLPHAELGHAENDVSLPAAAATLNSLPCASTPGHVSSAVRTPGADPTSAGVGGEMDGSVTPSDPLLSGERKTLPAGVLGQTEFEMLSAADPVASASQEAERARQLLLQTREGKARDDAGEQDAKVHLETAPYYRMVCRVLRRFHETTADNISDRVKSIVAAAAAANEEKPHTRTSSRLLSYQNRSLSSRSPLALRSSSSSERRLQSSRQKSQGGDEEGHAAPEGAIQFPHASGPLDEREVVLCVPLRADDVEFVVKREKVFNALNLCWNPGMKFRMLFHTAVSAASDSAACTKDRETAGAAAASGKDNGAAAAGGGTAAAAGTANHNAGAGAGSASGDRAAGTGGDKSSLSTTTRYTGTIRRVDLLHPDFWENVLVEWEDRSRAGGVATAAGSGVGGASRGSSGDKGERGSGQKSDADSGFENVSLWELEPLKRLKRPGGSNTGD